MSELYIDPIVFDAVEGKPLPNDHRAKRFAAGLPAWHPVRRLLTGETQWLGEIDNVLGFLQLFSEVYADRLQRADEDEAPRMTAPLDQVDIPAELAAFQRLFPDDILYRGKARDGRARHYSLRTLLTNARDAIAIKTKEFPPLRTVGLDAFDRTLAKLVRAVRIS